MAQVRDSVLDRLCEGIGEERDTMNRARTEEQSLIASALKRMVEKRTQVYRHARIELSRVPGAEKLRVRLTKEEGDAAEGDLEQPDKASEGQGDADESLDELGTAAEA